VFQAHTLIVSNFCAVISFATTERTAVYNSALLTNIHWSCPKYCAPAEIWWKVLKWFLISSLFF